MKDYEFTPSNEDIALALKKLNLKNGKNEVEEVKQYLDKTKLYYETKKTNSLKEKKVLIQKEIINQINEYSRYCFDY